MKPNTRKIFLAAAAQIALVIAGLAVTASAQDLRVPGKTNLFISPCGEPFSADQKDPYPIVKWFNGADANHDGKLDIDEMRNDAARFFKVLDRNGDGSIDGPEITFYENRLVPEILAPPNASLQGGFLRVDLQGVGIQNSPDTSPTSARQGASFFSLFNEPEPVRSADRNFDYKVSLQEFLAHSDRHFKALDVDGVGYLTLARLPRTAAEAAAHAHR
jgi:Ca2+-binding EF-hand superfamily protein